MINTHSVLCCRYEYTVRSNWKLYDCVFEYLHEFRSDSRDIYRRFRGGTQVFSPQKILVEISTTAEISAKIWFFKLSKMWENFFRRKLWQKLLPSQKFLPKYGFSSFQKSQKMVDNPQKSTHIDGIWICVSEDLENSEKSIYPQFGRFRWPESADLTKSENFMFFDFLRSFYVHFPHCKFDEYRISGWNYNAENDHFTWNLAHFTAKFER